MNTFCPKSFWELGGPEIFLMHPLSRGSAPSTLSLSRLRVENRKYWIERTLIKLGLKASKTNRYLAFHDDCNEEYSLLTKHTHI